MSGARRPRKASVDDASLRKAHRLCEQAGQLGLCVCRVGEDFTIEKAGPTERKPRVAYDDRTRDTHELGHGGRRQRVEQGAAGRGAVDAIENRGAEVHVQLARRAESLDDGDSVSGAEFTSAERL
jgi:hypothetical protein